jgi:hypothetical protein
MTYDTDTFDFGAAKLELKAYARDYDGGWSDNEVGWATMTLLGPDMWGDHILQVASADFKFDVRVQVKPIN